MTAAVKSDVVAAPVGKIMNTVECNEGGKGTYHPYRQFGLLSR